VRDRAFVRGLRPGDPPEEGKLLRLLFLGRPPVPYRPRNPMSRTETLRIGDQLRRALEGGAWHGAALLEIIGDMTADEAAARPVPSAHSAWEIVLHVTVWLETVRRRLEGEPFEPDRSADWPRAPGRDDAARDAGARRERAWEDARDHLRRAHCVLREELDRLDDRDLERPVPGQSYTVSFMLHGVIQHTLYHAGQIVILKKAVRQE
jgi:uncharacterized damage-inducible protein DinB